MTTASRIAAIMHARLMEAVVTPVHTSSTRSINKAIAAAGIKHITLLAGRGYQYFVFSDGVAYETQSVMVCYVRDLSILEWVERAKDWEAAF